MTIRQQISRKDNLEEKKKKYHALKAMRLKCNVLLSVSKDIGNWLLPKFCYWTSNLEITHSLLNFLLILYLQECKYAGLHLLIRSHPQLDYSCLEDLN